MFTNSTQRHDPYHRETKAWRKIHEESITSKRYSDTRNGENR
jgi:hypothetical protein